MMRQLQCKKKRKKRLMKFVKVLIRIIRQRRDILVNLSVARD